MALPNHPGSITLTTAIRDRLRPHSRQGETIFCKHNTARRVEKDRFPRRKDCGCERQYGGARPIQGHRHRSSIDTGQRPLDAPDRAFNKWSILSRLPATECWWLLLSPALPGPEKVPAASGCFAPSAAENVIHFYFFGNTQPPNCI
jgi:hypothetical protein